MEKTRGTNVRTVRHFKITLGILTIFCQSEFFFCWIYVILFIFQEFVSYFSPQNRSILCLMCNLSRLVVRLGTHGILDDVPHDWLTVSFPDLPGLLTWEWDGEHTTLLCSTSARKDVFSRFWRLLPLVCSSGLSLVLLRTVFFLQVHTVYWLTCLHVRNIETSCYILWRSTNQTTSGRRNVQTLNTVWHCLSCLKIQSLMQPWLREEYLVF